ncbi:MAG TPA: phosphoribosylanthranilate isomerase [Armatimonadaceae bacterium]|nr:phosphoribosylanthranilate isomerase [Armatimonadaceae bacterium]
MTRIKVCGITNTEDARAACDYGADALGFIFVPRTPRYVGGDLAAARRLMHDVPPLVWRIGVFDTPPADFSGPPELHCVQYYHGPPTVQTGTFAPYRHTPIPIKAFRVKDEESVRAIVEDRDPKELVLLDAYSPNALGGTGHTFNWELAKQVKRLGLPVVLAGGLTPENVAEAVAAVRPYMVDVSSGVEAEPGRKDHEKLRRFIRAVREIDISQGQ